MLIQNNENLFWISSREERIKKVEAGLLAAIRVTDSNLINMKRRIDVRNEKSPSWKEISSRQMILQSEALTIFKGHMIKILKQVYTSSDMNRLKRVISFNLKLDDVQPLVANVKVIWLNERVSYVAPNLFSIQSEIGDAFRSITVPEIERQGLSALQEHTQDERETFNIPTGGYTTNPLQINFDTLNQIKFTV